MVATWTDVKQRLDAEETTIQELRKGTPSTISDFYPELKTSRQERDWASMGQLPLVACVLTAPLTLVDLYDWDSEDQLIKAYGVNLDFLCKLRDAGHIRLFANLPPERYRRESCTWLYEQLSHNDTIWRSLRTPSYFDARRPGLADLRTAQQDRLSALFKTLSGSQLDYLYKNVQSTHPPDSPESLSRLLATWYSYVCGNDPDEAEETWNEFRNDPEFNMLTIRQKYLMYAPLETAALGGTLRLTEDKISSYFPDEIPLEVLSENAEIRALHDYLVNLKFGYTPDDLSYAAVWNAVGPSIQREILQFLDADKERAELLKTEQNLRLLLFSKRDVRATMEGIEKYVGRLKKYYESLESIGNIGFGASALALMTNSAGIAEIPVEWILYLNLPKAVPYLDVVLRKIPSQLLEDLIPHLQVVKYVKRQRTK